MVMYGAETEELDRIAAEMVAVADELDAGAKGITAVVANLAWFGEAALSFISDWTSLKVPRLNMSTVFLRDAATELRHQAREQRLASDRCGSDYVRSPAWTARERIASGLDNALENARQQGPAEQLRWWQSLSEDQRDALVQQRPGEVMVLDGLPDDVGDAARRVWLRDVVPATVTLSKTSISADVDANVYGALAVALGASTSIARNGDGSYDVEVGSKVGAGGKISRVSSTGALGSKLKLHFETDDELDEFVYDLVAAETSAEPMRSLRRAELLSEHAGSGESGVLSATISAKAGDVKTAASLSHTEHFVTHVTTEKLKISGDLGSSATTDISLAYSAAADGTPKKVVVEVAGATGAIGSLSEGLLKSPVAFTGGAMERGTATFSLDLTRAEVAGAVPAVSAAIGRGDPTGVFEALGAASEQVAVRFETAYVSELGVDVDGVAAGASAKIEYEQIGRVWIRPPGGDLREIPSEVVRGDDD